MSAQENSQYFMDKFNAIVFPNSETTGQVVNGMKFSV